MEWLEFRDNDRISNTDNIHNRAEVLMVIGDDDWEAWQAREIQKQLEPWEE